MKVQAEYCLLSVVTTSFWCTHSLPAFTLAFPFRVLLPLIEFEHELSPQMRIVTRLRTPIRNPKQLIDPRQCQHPQDDHFNDEFEAVEYWFRVVPCGITPWTAGHVQCAGLESRESDDEEGRRGDEDLFVGHACGVAYATEWFGGTYCS